MDRPQAKANGPVAVAQDRDRTDELTALYDKSYFEEAIVREVGRAHRYYREVTVLVLDIDRFRRVNDAHGQPTGDRLLRQLASVFTRELRGSDVPARSGGDEFALILPETPKAHGGLVAERLRERIAGHEFLDAAEQPIGPVTVSVGIATYPEDATTCEELVAVADRRLDEAKRRGRDLVVLADAESGVTV